MIYCVIPREWQGEMYQSMVAYYAENSDVTVIVDRREPGDRRAHSKGEGPFERTIRDRRRARIVGTFPTIEFDR